MDQGKQEPQGSASTGGVAQVEVKRHEDYTTLYANHLYLEPSFWDLKICFGELDQTGGHVTVEVHTGMNISWPLVKVLSYLLQVHIASQEMANGRIKMPSNAVPELPPPPSGDPQALKAHETFKKMRDQFIADML